MTVAQNSRHLFLARGTRTQINRKILFGRILDVQFLHILSVNEIPRFYISDNTILFNRCGTLDPALMKRGGNREDYSSKDVLRGTVHYSE